MTQTKARAGGVWLIESNRAGRRIYTLSRYDDRSPFRHSAITQNPRVHLARVAYARAGDRTEHRDLQSDQRSLPARASVSTAGAGARGLLAFPRADGRFPTLRPALLPLPRRPNHLRRIRSRKRNGRDRDRTGRSVSGSDFQNHRELFRCAWPAHDPRAHLPRRGRRGRRCRGDHGTLLESAARQRSECGRPRAYARWRGPHHHWSDPNAASFVGWTEHRHLDDEAVYHPGFFR